MAAPTRPVLAQTPPRPRPPVVSAQPIPKLWTFSFRFWKQIEYFGLDKSATKWFVSLLEKFTDLSKISIDDFMANGPVKTLWRYHDISWTQKNIPIQRADLTWLPPDYRENEAEYPLVQFQISKSLGRVVGFWDENQVFNVVLLDPLHNIQPTRSFDYKVNPCSPLPCLYTTLLDDVQKIQKKECTVADCAVRSEFLALPGAEHSYTVSILRIDDDIFEATQEVIAAGKAKSVEDVIFHGATSLLDAPPKTEKPAENLSIQSGSSSDNTPSSDSPPTTTDSAGSPVGKSECFFTEVAGELEDNVRLLSIKDIPGGNTNNKTE